MVAWEYCRVTLGEGEKHYRGLLSEQLEGWGYDCDITYFGPAGTISRQVLSAHQNLTADPFEQVLQRLGAGGWELVCVQHGIGASGQPGPDAPRLAYFKRPIIAGREIDEPELVIEEAPTRQPADQTAAPDPVNETAAWEAYRRQQAQAAELKPPL